MALDTNNRLLVGINYPWIDYGWDFGNPPPAWVNTENLPAWRERKRKCLVEDFTRFADQGLFAVRWFILPDGLNYGTASEAPQNTDGRWTFDPLPAQHEFHAQLVEDFEFVLKTCEQLRMQFVPSLIDFHWCQHGIVPEGSPTIVKGGRADIVIEPVKREAFFDRVLEPLLEVSLRYPQTIYAWELINEPEWVTTEKHTAEENKIVSKDRMLEFIREGVGRINNKRLPDHQQAFRSTVGFAHYDTLFDWNSAALGVTLHQFHFYAQKDGKLPPHIFSSEYPCFIGEFATAPMKEKKKEWPELKKKKLEQTIPNRLRWIEEKGYPAAFLWSALPMLASGQQPDVATSWTAREIRDTIAYVNASRGDSGDTVA